MLDTLYTVSLGASLAFWIAALIEIRGLRQLLQDGINERK